MKNKFDFYEIVEIKPKNGCLDLSKLDTRKFNYQILVGKRGTILGMVQNDDGCWLYDVCLKSEENRFTIREEDLKSTGMKADPNDFMTNEFVKVRVNPKTGEGEIVDEDE